MGRVEKLGSCSGGGQTYRVTAVVTVDNKTAQAAVLATTDLDSTYKEGSGKHTQSTLGMSSDGGFRPGRALLIGAGGMLLLQVRRTGPRRPID